MQKRRLVGLLMSFVLFVSMFFVLPFSIHAETTKLAKIISKDPSVVELCFTNGIGINETYETFFLAEINEKEEELLRSLHLTYEIIPDAGKICFGGYEFVSNKDKSFNYPEGLTLNPANPDKQLMFVQFIGPIKQEWKDILIQNNVMIGMPVNTFGLIIQANQSLIDFIQSLRFIKAVGIMPDACKTGKAIDSSAENIHFLSMITLLHFNLTELERQLHDSTIELSYEETSVNGIITIKNLPISLLPILLKNQDIVMINPINEPIIFNAEASQVLNINDSTDLNQIAGLKGEGEIVGVADTGLSSGNIATLNPAFVGKIVATFPPGNSVYPNPGWYDLNGHGTHVCGSVLGNGAGDTPSNNARYRGMAPEAKLVFQYYGYNNSIYTILSDAYNAGARIHSNSWSNENNSWGQYDTNARDIDQLMWEHMDMQVLFAAGNSRAYSQYGVWPPANNGTHTLTNFCGAKNGITVGASQNNNPSYFFNRMASFSSLGPTHDNRIKPDVIAPGNQIRSTHTMAYYNPYPTVAYANSYRSMSGTSMATPVTAGALALIRENYRKTYQLPPSEIPASLLKATMINGCNTTNVFDHTNYSGGPQLFLSRNNFTSGYGRVDIKNSVFPSDKNWMFYNEYASDHSRGLKQGELIKKYYVYVAQTSQPLKATLAWTDMPGTPCAYNYVSGKGYVPDDYYDPTPELVNDLDITITKYVALDPVIMAGPTEQYVGNRFNPDGFSTNLMVSGILNPQDSLNNVEVVNIQNPTVGVYEIEVSALRSGIQSDSAHGFRQPFSLVVSGPAISTTNPPSAPMTITGKTTCSTNEITWTEGSPKKDPIHSFRVTRITITGPQAGSISTNLVPANVHEWIDTNIVIGTEYFYYIQAINTRGMVSDNSTGIQLGLITPPGITGFYTPVIRPTNVVLYWSTPKPGTCPVAGYYLYRSDSAGILGTLISPLISTLQPAFADINVGQGETWYYTVIAVDTHGLLGGPSKQLKVMIPVDQTETVLTVEASKKDLCQGDDVTFKITIYNKSAVLTDALKLVFNPTSDIAFKGSDRLTGVTNPSGSIEFLIGKLPAKSTYTFTLFCQQSGAVQWERSTHLFFTLSDPNSVLNQEELTLTLKKCGGGNNQGALGIIAKVLNIVTDPSTGERYLPFGEELKLSLEFSGGSGPFQLSVNWGDGQIDKSKMEKLETQTLSHLYGSKGTMNIQIEITDSAGNTKKVAFTILVR